MNNVLFLMTRMYIYTCNPDSRTEDEAVPAVRDRIRQFEDKPAEDSMVTKVGKQRPTSSAFNYFEEKGIIITQVTNLNY